MHGRKTGPLRLRRAGRRGSPARASRGHAPASGRRRRQKAGGKSRAGLLGRRSPLRTPILAILFVVGLRCWLGRGPWEISRTLNGHSDGVGPVSFSPDGRRIVTTSADRTARVWDAESGRCLLVLEGHKRGVNAASYSPDGGRIVTSSDETARVWDAESGDCLFVLKGHEDSVTSARFSPDGKRIATADNVSHRLWDAGSGAPVACFLAQAHRASCAFSPDGGRVVASISGEAAVVYSAADGEWVLGLKSDRRDLVDPYYGGSTKDVWYMSVDYSPDGGRILTASVLTARLWDAGTGELLHVLRGHEDRVSCAAFSPDGGRILTADVSHAVWMWDAATGRPLFSVRENELADWDDSPGFFEASFSPDGTRFVTMSEGRISHVWDARTGEKLARLGGSAVLHAEFSPDGNRLATAGEGRRVRVWKRRRPERASGYLHLPEVWLTVALGVAFLWSLSRDLSG